MSENSAPGGPGVEADLETMLQLMGRLIRAMKGPGGPKDADELLGHVTAAGLNPRHVPVLMTLAVHGPRSVGGLARHLALNPATASQLVGELQRAGFVARTPDERDRRRMIVSLDTRHHEMIERFARRRVRPLREALEALTPVEREHFLYGWRTVVERVEADDEDEAGSGGCPMDRPPCG